MIVTRFMSLREFEAFERGETLINNTDHFDGGKGGSQSVGFCFTVDAPEVDDPNTGKCPLHDPKANNNK